ncbi:hypothetical protein ILYODFUR_037083 [Ilyodon furcidens]|uniref:Secreted protein n=1 Tax=Ilyodon furcidens TaxID=33524 RepID=A0ABV0TPZ2_9TELE
MTKTSPVLPSAACQFASLCIFSPILSPYVSCLVFWSGGAYHTPITVPGPVSKGMKTFLHSFSVFLEYLSGPTTNQHHDNYSLLPFILLRHLVFIKSDRL